MHHDKWINGIWFKIFRIFPFTMISMLHWCYTRYVYESAWIRAMISPFVPSLAITINIKSIALSWTHFETSKQCYFFFVIFFYCDADAWYQNGDKNNQENANAIADNNENAIDNNSLVEIIQVQNTISM